MTDRELLQLAAKAAGYSHYEYVESDYRDGRKVTGHYDSLLEVCINPLADDGDALRLAVKLDIHFMVVRGRGFVVSKTSNRFLHSNIKGDEMAAVRRAIVRAAAEIGKNMK